MGRRLAILLACVFAASPAWAESLLYNPGPRYITTLNLCDIDWPTGCWAWGTELWEGHLDGNPPNQWGGVTCTDGIYSRFLSA